MKTKKTQPPHSTEQQTNRPPDFHVWCIDAKTQIKGDIGVAWANPDGTFSIKLNPFVVLDSGMGLYQIRMYPILRGDKNGRAN